MILVEKKYKHYINDKVDIKVKLDRVEPYNIYIVYYINCLINENYFDWIYNHMKIVEPYGGTIFIIATISPENENSLRTKCLEHFPNITVQCNYINEYEYPGILKVWELGQQYRNRNDIILYFHSKGISHNINYNPSVNIHKTDIDNANIVISDIDRIKEIFNIFPTIKKIGYFAGGNGWIWYNFWWVRGNYVSKLEKPIKTNRRHYYEDWLGRRVPDNQPNIVYNDRPISFYKNTLHICYGIYTDCKKYGNIGSFWCPGAGKMFEI